MKDVKVVVISDLHCGHRGALTPPDYQYKKIRNPRTLNEKEHNLFASIQMDMYKWFMSEIKRVGPIDILIVNGDAIDGQAKKNSGNELITSNLDTQESMAIDVINSLGAGKVYMTYGSGYHVGKSRDSEKVIANEVCAEVIDAKLHLDINGVMFNVKHKCSRPAMPHGQANAVGREKLFNTIASEGELEPSADILIRSHVHRYCCLDMDNYTAFTTPSFQLFSKYGARECAGTVSIGFISFDINKKGEVSWEKHLAKLEDQKAKVVKVKL